MIGNVLHFNSIWVYSPLRILPLPEVTSYTSPRTERYMSPSSFPPLLPWLRTGYWYEIIVFRYESDNEINCVCVIQLIPSLLFSPITTHLDNSSTEITRFTLSSLIAAAKERRKETSANLELEAIFELWSCAGVVWYKQVWYHTSTTLSLAITLSMEAIKEFKLPSIASMYKLVSF